jgi:DNA-directed RNA polymerase subunit M/transcription elongation factor TFIIS
VINEKGITNRSTYLSNFQMTDCVRTMTKSYLCSAGCTPDVATKIEQDLFEVCESISTSDVYDLDDPLSNDYLEYKLRCRKVIYNIHHVLPKVKLGTLPFELTKIARQSDIVVRPEKWKEHINRSELIKQTKMVRVTASTDQFTCGKCGKKETNYYLRQTRGMDEPETVFITCVHCNNKWRQ